MTIYQKIIKNSAFESPWFVLSSFCNYEHFTSIPEHLWAYTDETTKFKNHILAGFVSARKVLVSVRTLQQYKVWIKSFQTHNLRSILDKKLLRKMNLKFCKFCIFQICLTKTAFSLRNLHFLREIWKCKISNSFFPVNFCPKYFGDCAFESSWSILYIVTTYGHVRALCEHLRALTIPAKMFFLDFAVS